MRKGQFIFNFLRDYMGTSTGKWMDNPYPNCHSVLFQISDEYWDKIEDEFKKFKKDPLNYVFPKKPFGDSLISPEHEKAMSESFSELFKDMKTGKYF